MKRILKWVGIGLGVLILIIVGLGVYTYWQGGQVFRQVHNVPKDNVTIPTDADSLARGKHLSTVLGCQECHMDDFRGGRVFIDDKNVATFASANLTSGKGGIGSNFSDQDWVNAIRYGVNRKGQSLLIMPSEYYYSLNDEDLGDIIGYLKSVPAVDNFPPDRKIGPMGRVLLATHQFPTATELVAALPPRPAPVEPGPTAEYGKYLADLVCAQCHGMNLAGAPFPPGDPNAKISPNLTPGGELLVWSQDDFVKAMRTGETPSGKKLDPDEMPWKYSGQMTDEELAALYAYLKSLPKTPSPTPAH